MTGIKVEIPKEVYDKVMYWVNKANFEVSGFGTLVYNKKEQSFIVQDAFLIKQEGSGAMTDIDAAALGKAMYHAHKNKLPGTLNWWWHSHVNMDVFWSTTDMETIKDLGKNGWIVASVFNKREEIRSAYCAITDVPNLGPTTHFLDDIDTEIANYYPTDLTASWDKEYNDTVTQKQWNQTAFGSTTLGRQWNSDLGPAATKVNPSWEEDWKPSPDLEKEYRKEAKILGMSYEKYINVINYGDYNTVCDLEEQLERKRNAKAESRA